MWDSRIPPADLWDFFRRHAERLLCYRAAPCSCRSTPDAPANTNCTACGGFGWFYPGQPDTIRAVIAQIRQDQVLGPWGQLFAGDLVADESPWGRQIAPFDVVLPSWARGEPYEGDVLVRGDGATDTLLYRAVKVLYCGSVNPSTFAQTAYVQGRDFSVSGRVLTWIPGGSAPAAGSNYAVRYDAQFEWMAFAPGQVRVERGVTLGQRSVLRKRHLVPRNLTSMPGSG